MVPRYWSGRDGSTDQADHSDRHTKGIHHGVLHRRYLGQMVAPTYGGPAGTHARGPMPIVRRVPRIKNPGTAVAGGLLLAPRCEYQPAQPSRDGQHRHLPSGVQTIAAGRPHHRRHAGITKKLDRGIPAIGPQLHRFGGTELRA